MHCLPGQCHVLCQCNLLQLLWGVYVCLGSSVECPISTILDWIILKEVTLSLSWSCLGPMSTLLFLLVGCFHVLGSKYSLSLISVPRV